MLDEYNREIDYVRISVTDRCNLRCAYCMPEKGVEFIPHEEILTYEEIIRLCQSFAKLGIRKVKITGGEPLVRKNLPLLIKSIKEIDGIENVTLTTNGLVLADHVEELVRAGIDSINVSLDTLNPEHFKTLTRFDKIDQVKKGIEETLKYENVTLKLNCVLLNTQDKEDILDLVSLAKKNMIHVRFIEVMPIGMGRELKGLKEEEIKDLISEKYGPLTPYKASLGNGPAHYYKVDDFKGKIGFISAVSHKFCSSCNRIRLTADGYLKNCLQYASGRDLKELIRSGLTDEELIKEIVLAINDKPKEHQFNEYNNKKSVNIEDKKTGNISVSMNPDDKSDITNDIENRRMSQIGG